MPGTTLVKLVQSFVYNDWQGRIQGWVRDDDPETATAISYIYPFGRPRCSTVQPIHVAFSWDAAAAKKVTLYLDGQPADSGYEHLYDDPDAFQWNFSETPYLYVGSRMYSGDWVGHNWEPNVDGVIDNIKVWDYAKSDFSDRFAEGVLHHPRQELSAFNVSAASEEALVSRMGKWLYRLSVRKPTSNRPEKSFLTHTIFSNELSTLLGVGGDMDVFIGFTSGTGAAGGKHDILCWNLKVQHASWAQILSALESVIKNSFLLPFIG